MNIYVGNLPYRISEDELSNAFAAHGKVDAARIITDKFTGDSKGFGFVEMPNADEGNAAIEALNGAELAGRTVKVNEARPRPEHTGGGGGGGGHRGGGGGRGGYRD